MWISNWEESPRGAIGKVPLAERVAVFDFDCTLTAHHMFYTLRTENNVEWMRENPDDFYTKIFGGPSRLPAVATLFRTLRASGVRTYILTHGFEHEVADALRWLGVLDGLEGVVGRRALQLAGNISKPEMLVQMVIGEEAGSSRNNKAPAVVGCVFFADDDRSNFPPQTVTPPPSSSSLSSSSRYLLRPLAMVTGGTAGMAGLWGFPRLCAMASVGLVATLFAAAVSALEKNASVRENTLTAVDAMVRTLAGGGDNGSNRGSSGSGSSGSGVIVDKKTPSSTVSEELSTWVLQDHHRHQQGRRPVVLAGWPAGPEKNGSGLSVDDLAEIGRLLTTITVE